MYHLPNIRAYPPPNSYTYSSSHPHAYYPPPNPHIHEYPPPNPPTYPPLFPSNNYQNINNAPAPYFSDFNYYNSYQFNSTNQNYAPHQDFFEYDHHHENFNQENNPEKFSNSNHQPKPTITEL